MPKKFNDIEPRPIGQAAFALSKPPQPTIIYWVKESVLGLKPSTLVGTNTLAYLKCESVKNKKGFMTLTPSHQFQEDWSEPAKSLKIPV